MFLLHIWVIFLVFGATDFIKFFFFFFGGGGFLPSANFVCSQANSGHLTIIPRGRVGYEMIDSQRGA